MKRSVVTYAHHAVVLLLLLCSLAACSHAKPGTTDEVDAATKLARETLARTLQRYSFAGQHDSVILVARPAYGDAARRHDTLMMVYTGLNMAQSYLFMGDMDSVRRYVDLIEPLKDFPLSSGLHIMRSNVLGSYLLRSSLDYSKALNNYIEGLEWADGRENTSDRIALLSNIVNIFYVQNSDKGYEYAREAYSLATTQEGVSLYAKCAACIVMAQMYYVKHDYDAAERYLTQADRYAQQGGAHSQMPFIYAMFAWISQSRGDGADASKFYDRALDFIRYTDPGTASQVYLTYGDYLLGRGERTAAAGMYRRGLEISDSTGNMEYRKSLLGQMADLSYEMGNYMDAARYSRMYKTYSDTTSNLREREFRELIEQREASEVERMMLARELFGKIKHLMRVDRIYRMKNLTLEVLADMTESNRTYCSRAINTFAGMSFNRYLDTFRIAEATRLIADRGSDMLFKQLADDIGYNSVTVFSKAFQRETGCTPSIYRKEVRGYKSDK